VYKLLKEVDDNGGGGVAEAKGIDPFAHAQ
jgi:hypothetical protein